MAKPEIVTACLLVIGNEILSGRTADVNLQFLARALNDLGIRLVEARVIRDDEETIVRTVNEVRVAFDYVFTTGGIGPTHDDITTAAVAKAFGVELERNPEAVALLTAYYPPGGLNEARLKMATLPAGASLIHNPVSTAPGFQIGNVLVLAGIPRVMQAMFDGIKHRLAGGSPVRSRAIAAFVPEGKIAAPLTALQRKHPGVEIGSYPFVRDGRFGTTLVLRSPDEGAIASAAEELKLIIRSLGVEPAEEGTGT